MEFREEGKVLLVILIIYIVLWFAILLSCKLGTSSGCIWNLGKYWFPFPRCVCVR